MKKVYIVLAVLLLVFTACAPRDPQERLDPLENEPNDFENELNNNNELDNGMENEMDEFNQNPNELENPDLETNQSSIFKRGEVQNCRITADATDVFNGIGNKFPKIGSLKKNDVVKVLDQIEDWYVVRLDNNQVGTIDASKATPIVKEGEDHQDGDPIREPQGDEATQEPINNRQPAQEETPEENQALDEPQDTQENVPRTDNNLAPLSSMEQQMVNLVNGERSKNGLNALTVDLEVSRVAEMKSQDMVENNYFSHNSPTYGSPFDMLGSFGIDYLAAGENLAGNSSVEGAHTGLMNSSGHRKNILKPEFTHIGIGVKPSNRYGYVFTQMFISKPK